jgi:hypothetical protein
MSWKNVEAAKENFMAGLSFLARAGRPIRVAAVGNTARRWQIHTSDV